MKSFYKLKGIVAEAEKDAIKFDTKNYIQAGLRLRKVMQEVRSVAVDIRKEIAEKNKIIKDSRK